MIECISGVECTLYFFDRFSASYSRLSFFFFLQRQLCVIANLPMKLAITSRGNMMAKGPTKTVHQNGP
jgi:hypothetical protein